MNEVTTAPAPVLPETGKPETSKPETGKPETSKPETGKPETGKPETGKPETGKPETGKPETGKPDSDAPDSGASTYNKEKFSYTVLSKYRSELMGIAMLMVMLFHAFDIDFGFELLNNIRAFGFCGVDVFFMLSAMGLVVSLSKRKQEYGEFMTRRAKRMLPAYFAVMLPYTLFQIFMYGAQWSSLFWNSVFLSYWVRCTGMFNWYVTGAMIFYAVTPWCYNRFKAAKRREIPALIGVLGCLLISQLLMREGYWHYMDIFYRTGTFTLGLLMGFYVVSERRVGVKGMLFWLGSFLAGVAYFLAASNIDSSTTPVFLPYCHIFIFTTVPMCLAFCWVFEKLSEFRLTASLSVGIRSAFSFIGKNSLEIYLLNVSIFTEHALLRKVLDFGPSFRLYYLIIISLNIALGALFHKLLERLMNRFKPKLS